ncbi:FtsW/RodA/SpoVE family cell cycle protein [uncultured Megasphaera sp.]|uniref:FtsW/RodA/SpoVE family cell cycle protein n=1 Tax=uncultured Megasphaera sp. TaxID=165188 RepID=UPI002607400E|nr:FtsW/RodA/SpoVE family cell cycle protein [uncultured Megasphaera sp.]
MTKETKELRRTYWALLTAFALLVAMGMANVFSATFVSDGVHGRFFNHLMRQAIFFAVGMGPALFLYKKDYRIWRNYTKWIIIGAVVLLLIVFPIGIVVNGARRWIGIAGFTFQPSEVAKLAGILYAASHLADFLEKRRPIEFLYRLSHAKDVVFWRRLRFVPHIALWGPLLMFLLVMEQPDAGTAFVILAIPAVMVFAGGARLSHIKWHCAVLGGGALLYLLSAPYRMNRIIAWLDPWEAHTDFAFAILAQEWGLRGSIFILLLFCTVVYFGAMTAWNCRDKFGMFTALGITLYFGGQGFINIGMVCGVLPVVGVPLPFISYGGTSLVVNMAAAALLLNICRQNYKQAMERAAAEPQPVLRSMKEETRSRFPLR